MIKLSINDLGVSYGTLEVLKGVSFDSVSSQWVMLIGPNGAGKSTIVNAIARGVDYTGDIYLDDRDIKTFKSNEYAQRVGVLEQNHYVSYDFTVREVVGLGRYAYSKGVISGKDDGEDHIESALEKTDMKAMEKKSVLALSGGELQRVFLAQLLAQDPDIMILDEPTNHLDLLYQRDIFAILSEWLKEKDHMIISVVHDLNLARKYGTHAVLLNDGVIESYGEIEEVVTRENLKKVYSMDVYDWQRQLLEQWKD